MLSKSDQTDAERRGSGRKTKAARQRRNWLRLGVVLSLAPLLVFSSGAAWAENPDDQGGASQNAPATEPGQTGEGDLPPGSAEPELPNPALPEGPDTSNSDPQSQAAASGDDAASGEIGLRDLGGITPFNAPSNSFCTPPGVFTLAMEYVPWVRSLKLTSATGTNAQSGTLGYEGNDALAIGSDCNWAYSINRTPSDNGFNVHRLSSTSIAGTSVGWFNSGITNFQQPTAGAIKRVGTSDIYYFGYYTYASSTATFQLFAFNVTTSNYIGRVAQIAMPAATSAGAGGDIAFDAQGNLILLWSLSDSSLLNRTQSVLASLNASDIPTSVVPGNLARTAALKSRVNTAHATPWNGLAYDSDGTLWLQRSWLSGVAGWTYLNPVNLATGALGTEIANFGYTGVDLASYQQTGPAAPTITVQKSIVGNRYAASDQFTLDVRQGTATLATRTTTGSGASVDSSPTDVISLTPGSQITIGETGVNPTNLGNYTWSYSCVWSGGGTLGDGTMTLSGSRASSAALTVPTGREDQQLACTITNTPRASQLSLQASLSNNRFNTGDQFKITIAQSGGAVLAEQTTQGTGSSITSPAAGAVNAIPAAIYTIAQTAASGSLGAYVMSYGCSWPDNTPFVAPGTALPYDSYTGRAEATLPPIPNNRNGQALTCTITNTAKDPADVPPVLVLQKNIESRTSGHQFHLAVHRVNDGTLLGENTTTGSVNGLQSGTRVEVLAEQGVTYSISEGAAGTATNLNGYAANYVCTWSGTGRPELARGVLSAGADGRLQAILPAIPAGKNGQTLDCTITNRLSPANGLECGVGQVYGSWNVSGSPAINSFGVRRIWSNTIGSGTPSRATTGTFATFSAANALGINMDGSVAFTAAVVSGAVQIHRWNVGNTAVTNIGVSAVTGTPAVTGTQVGAIDPTTGIYYFGYYSPAGSSTALVQLQLFAYDPSKTPAQYWLAAKVNVPKPPVTPLPSHNSTSNNGDIAFDSQGNLYLIWSPGNTVSNNNSVLASLAAGNVPTSQPSSVTAVTAGFISTLDGQTSTSYAFNGASFDAAGELYVSFGAGVKRLDPSTGADIGGTLTTGTNDFIDLSGCGLPPTMRLQKDIIAPRQGNDQFRIEIRADRNAQSDTLVQDATTSGSTTGVQTADAGPTVVTVGKTYTIREVGAPGTDLSKYITSYSCQWSDESSPKYFGMLGPVTGNTNAREARIGPIPSAAEVGTPKGKAGQQLICTITNQPLLPATVTAKKTVQDPSGQNAVGAADWTIAAGLASGTTSGTAIAPTGAQTTITGGSVPQPWQITFLSSSALANVSVGETQQQGFVFVPGTGSGSALSGSYCRVTPFIGQPRIVLLSSETSVLSSIITGDHVECEFVNRQRPGTAVWQKVDAASPSAYLRSSEWLLTGTGVPANTIVTDCVVTGPTLCPTGLFTDQDPLPGRFKLTGLVHGDYTLVEAKAPAGFIIDDTTTHDFSILPSALDYAFTAPFENERREMPAIPLTGGMGADAYLIGGVAVFGIGVLAGWLLWRRRRQEA